MWTVWVSDRFLNVINESEAENSVIFRTFLNSKNDMTDPWGRRVYLPTFPNINQPFIVGENTNAMDSLYGIYTVNWFTSPTCCEYTIVPWLIVILFFHIGKIYFLSSWSGIIWEILPTGSNETHRATLRVGDSNLVTSSVATAPWGGGGSSVWEA